MVQPATYLQQYYANFALAFTLKSVEDHAEDSKLRKMGLIASGLQEFGALANDMHSIWTHPHYPQNLKEALTLATLVGKAGGYTLDYLGVTIDFPMTVAQAWDLVNTIDPTT